MVRLVPTATTKTLVLNTKTLTEEEKRDLDAILRDVFSSEKGNKFYDNVSYMRENSKTWDFLFPDETPAIYVPIRDMFYKLDPDLQFLIMGYIVSRRQF